MTKQTIIDVLKRSCRAEFISRQELAEAMGYEDAHAVDRYLSGLDKLGKKYYIGDVAEAMSSEITK